ncbi:hypothetical protein [Algoriphagus sediminis]|uniref:Uncharacterized protein n=1 Tax=Algoriphagus sediminis TaxID=3057113 RepID=A0ABT7YCC1_9BACT|nr:hypothetical protein [Algoriphagus sediminis]MDN3204116.1 hypothetical protein [Algoriphagus sediminis]
MRVSIPTRIPTGTRNTSGFWLFDFNLNFRNARIAPKKITKEAPVTKTNTYLKLPVDATAKIQD